MEHITKEGVERIREAYQHLSSAEACDVLRLLTYIDFLEREVDASIRMAGPHAIRVCEGGGPEELCASLAVTISNLKGEVERLEKEGRRGRGLGYDEL